MNIEISHEGSHYRVAIIPRTSDNLVLDLYKDCHEYFEIVEDKKPGMEHVVELFEDVPPGKEIEDKFIIGIYTGSRLMGVVDLIRDYPEAKSWIIGLYMIHPDFRSSGLAQVVHSKLAEFVDKAGGEKIVIGVVEDNTIALKFWSKLGYKRSREVTQTYGNKTSLIFVEELLL